MTLIANSPNKPRVGITPGDPAGIGFEIVLKSLADGEVRDVCLPVVIADAAELQRQAALLGLPCPYQITGENELPGSLIGRQDPVIVDITSHGEPGQWGKASARAGRAAISFIEASVRLCLENKLDAMATAPINKEALHMAGCRYPGHTEMLAALCGAGDSMMCFFAGTLRVALLTVHLSLADAIRAITREKVSKALVLADRELRRFGLDNPRLGVAGLNPHAGEGGLFGSEEAREIQPAIEECRLARGIDVTGPLPADTLFVRAARGEFDAVLACYHDQGLIAVKCLAFGEAVNVTLGLPIIRTSVDHGTAFDIAGRGVADHRSLVEAIKLAARLSTHQRPAT